MKQIVTRLTLSVAALALLSSACLKSLDPRLRREAVLPLLQKEAESLKRDGEKVDPALGVRATWNIEAVEVKELPDNDTSPWAGTIRFKIESRMREVDGSIVTQSFEKRFEYVYNSTLRRWIIQYTPPAPAKNS